jgi:predicted lactoylglutathione lyase
MEHPLDGGRTAPHHGGDLRGGATVGGQQHHLVAQARLGVARGLEAARHRGALVVCQVQTEGSRQGISPRSKTGPGPSACLITSYAATNQGKHLGFSFDQQFPVENMKALVINDDSRVVLVTESQFKADIETNIKKDFADTTTSAEVIVQLRVDSKQQVDELVDKALAAGGQMANPTNDRGFLYGRSFQDLDRHLWDVFIVPQEIDCVENTDRGQR